MVEDLEDELCKRLLIGMWLSKASRMRCTMLKPLIGSFKKKLVTCVWPRKIWMS